MYIVNTIKIIFAVLSVIFEFFAFFPYARDIFLNKTRPHIYTWLIWTITQGVAVVGIWYGKGGLGSISLTLGTFTVFLIFLFSFRNGKRDITKFDTLVLLLALSAILVWWQLDNPVMSVILVSIADTLGFFPSFRKSWVDPNSETLSTWMYFVIGNIFAILALSEYNLLTLLYISVITLADLVIFFIIFNRRIVSSAKVVKSFE